MGWWRRMRRRVAGTGMRFALIIFWIVINNIIFWTTYYKYNKEPRHYYLRKMLGSSLCISRGTAAMLNVSCSLILLPMCRSLITFTKGQKYKIPKKFVRLFLDRCKHLHICFAVTIIFAAVVHTIAHVVNAEKFSQNYNFIYPDLNIASHPEENPILLIIRTGPGITGFIMVIILTLLISSSTHYVRTMNYDVFWYIHHLYIVFLLLLIIHPMRGVLKEQTNIQDHTPGCRIAKNITVPHQYIYGNVTWCKHPPRFALSHSDTWIWVSVPLVFYLGDVFYRYLNRRHPVRIISIRHHPCHVIEFHLLQRSFTASPGQYILMQFPEVSTYEWHPFSLTSCPSPGEPEFKVHMRIHGDWTRKVKALLMAIELNKKNFLFNNEDEFSLPNLEVRLHVDGPFSSPIEDVFIYPISICIAGGIGVTPFAAILNYLLTDNPMRGNVRRLHFLWICQQVEPFLWFAQLLSDLHFKLWNENKPDFLDVQLYVTRTQNPQMIQMTLKHPFTLLEKRVQCGRPDWKNLFHQWRTAYAGVKVGVFCCGPKLLRRQVRRMCIETSVRGVSFSYHQESLS